MKFALHIKGLYTTVPLNKGTRKL